MNDIVIKYIIAFVMIYVLTFIEDIDIFKNNYIIVVVILLLGLNVVYLSDEVQYYSLFVLFVNLIILTTLILLVHRPKSNIDNNGSSHSQSL
jgi:hypothetical protein